MLRSSTIEEGNYTEIIIEEGVNNNNIERLRIEKYINFFLYRNKLRTDKTVNINKDIIIHYPTQKNFLYLIRGDISDINFKYFAGVVGFVYLWYRNIRTITR